ncbi:hypothetical protein O181_034522 [Austropuccinia psidii MF-1]|uniref:Uncharacterized protein n=1 Tax=Austropuccinia psidii MF-1 TaxID=1389203 RepID=A0A9Q3D6S0_9BASI|nr:hypothetical protein [Austropuccinia psidii MF-1]
MRILHGSILWYTKKNANTVTKLLNPWHHKDTQLSTGMMRQPPIFFLKHYGNVPDFTKHTKLIHNYIHSKLADLAEDPAAEMIQWELPSIPPYHPSPLNIILKKDDLLRNCQNNTHIYNSPMGSNNSPN